MSSETASSRRRQSASRRASGDGRGSGRALAGEVSAVMRALSRAAVLAGMNGPCRGRPRRTYACVRNCASVATRLRKPQHRASPPRRPRAFRHAFHGGGRADTDDRNNIHRRGTPMVSGHLQRHALTTALIAILASPALVSTAHAQDAAPAAEERPTTLSGITVTAQKREEALQDVPIVINVLPEQLLLDTGVRDIKDMQVLVPGLTVTSTQSAAQTTARIRGIGTVGDNPGLESSVGVVIDGVYRARNSVSFGDLGELERIEVLKGPQGTVFGKTTSAGVINVSSRRRTSARSAEAAGRAGSSGLFGVSGCYSAALGDNVAFRIYATRGQRDRVGDVFNANGPRQDTEAGDQNYHAVRAQLLFGPT